MSPSISGVYNSSPRTRGFWKFVNLLEKLPSPRSGYGHREFPDLRSAPVQGIIILESSQLSSISQFRRSHPISPLHSQIAILRLRKRIAQSRDRANILHSLKIGCAISRLACNFRILRMRNAMSRLACNFRILRMRSAISRLHKFLDCTKHFYAKFTARSSTYVGLAQTRSNYQSIWLCQWLHYLCYIEPQSAVRLCAPLPV